MRFDWGFDFEGFMVSGGKIQWRSPFGEVLESMVVLVAEAIIGK